VGFARPMIKKIDAYRIILWKFVSNFINAPKNMKPLILHSTSIFRQVKNKEKYFLAFETVKLPTNPQNVTLQVHYLTYRKVHYSLSILKCYGILKSWWELKKITR